MSVKPIRLSDFDIMPDAKVIISGTLAFANITHKNTKSLFTPTYGLTIDMPTYTAPDHNKDSLAFKNDTRLANYLYAHEKREKDRHGKDRLHLTWKSGGKLKGKHMPIAGKANLKQLKPVDSGNLLAKRDKDNHVLGRDGKPIKVNDKPVTDVCMIPSADKLVDFKKLRDGQLVQVTYISFESSRYHRLGSTIKALVVKDLDNLELYSENANRISTSFGLTPDGDNTVNIQINPKIAR